MSLVSQWIITNQHWFFHLLNSILDFGVDHHFFYYSPFTTIHSYRFILLNTWTEATENVNVLLTVCGAVTKDDCFPYWVSVINCFILKWNKTETSSLLEGHINMARYVHSPTTIFKTHAIYLLISFMPLSNQSLEILVYVLHRLNWTVVFPQFFNRTRCFAFVAQLLMRCFSGSSWLYRAVICCLILSSAILHWE